MRRPKHSRPHRVTVIVWCAGDTQVAASPDRGAVRTCRARAYSLISERSRLHRLPRPSSLPCSSGLRFVESTRPPADCVQRVGRFSDTRCRRSLERASTRLSTGIVQRLPILLELAAYCIINEAGPQHLKLSAIAQVTARPFVVETLRPDLLEAYWEDVALCNTLFDQCMGLSTAGTQVLNLRKALELCPALLATGTDISKLIAQILRDLGS